MPDQNKTLISWLIPEYRQHKRNRRWYIAATAAFLLLLTYALAAANFLFALILIIAGMVVVLQDKRKAAQIEFAIGEGGIQIGQAAYEFGKFQSFWIYYEPDEAKTLFLEFKNKIRPRLPIPLFNKNPLQVRQILLKYLAEDIDREHEPVSEQLSRLLKI